MLKPFLQGVNCSIVLASQKKVIIMCGIAAIIESRPQHPLENLLLSMCASIAHRGPDEAGLTIFSGQGVGLGHTRLSIMDLAGGTQPLLNEEQTIAVICNGEIYDYEQIRKELETRGHRFSTHSDSEILIHLYQEYGEDFIGKLNGEFAFIIWDSLQEKLIAARDRAGIRPLFFNWSDHRLLLCSEIKGILQDPRVDTQISSNYIYSAALGAVHDSVSPFENIEVVRPGHVLTAQLGKPPTQKAYHHWHFSPDSTLAFADAKHMVRSTLTDSVKRRLVADVPVECYLSGGIDSAIVCALLAAQKTNVKAFHVTFPDSVYSETEQAKTVASHCGATLNILECRTKDILENLADTVWSVESPLPNCNSVSKFMLSEQVRSNGTKVCLTGEGADEIFGGYPFFKIESLWRNTISGGQSTNGYSSNLASLMSDDGASIGSVWNPIKHWRSAPRPYGEFPNYLHLSCIDNGAIIPPLSGFSLNRNHLEQQFLHLFPPEQFQHLSPFNMTRAMALHRLAGGIIPLLADRVELAHGLECRLPFLDVEMLELASGFPEDFFINPRQNTDKHILREAFSDLLPQNILQIGKKPFLAPQWRCLFSDREGRQWLDHLLSYSMLKKSGFFSPIFVKFLEKIWLNIPAKAQLLQKMDPLMGLIITSQILYEKFQSERYTKSHIKVNLVKNQIL